MIPEKTAEILSQILHRPIKPTDNIQRSTEELWDSLKHIEIAVTIEEEFDVSLTTEMIKNMDSMAKIVEFVQELKNE